ncbi:MAG: cell division protein FtsL [Lachnospiraceae bacterium]|nr:cell division protein FtsL [Lachnospiraceae bacterium]
MARSRRQTTYEKEAYIQGNAVRKLQPSRVLQEPPKKLSHRTRKNRDKALYMNLGYVLFLVVALAVAGMILLGYIRIESEITLSVRNISSLESELNNLKLSNDEAYHRIVSSIDLEEIKRVAIEELGMRYAGEGQIINVTGEGSDYMRQLSDIGE